MKVSTNCPLYSDFTPPPLQGELKGALLSLFYQAGLDAEMVAGCKPRTIGEALHQGSKYLARF